MLTGCVKKCEMTRGTMVSLIIITDLTEVNSQLQLKANLCKVRAFITFWVNFIS